MDTKNPIENAIKIKNNIDKNTLFPPFENFDIKCVVDDIKNLLRET